MPPETKIDCEHLARNLHLDLKKKKNGRRKKNGYNFFWFFNNLKNVD
jgi:hypothetical protein